MIQVQYKIERKFIKDRRTASLKIRIRNLKKTTANRYMPGLFDITRDLCALMTNDTSQRFLLQFVETVDKGTVDKIKPFFRACPYTVSATFKCGFCFIGSKYFLFRRAL